MQLRNLYTLIYFPGTRVVPYTPVNSRLRAYRLTWHIGSREEEKALLDFWESHRGGYNRFWCPIWDNRYVLWEDYVAGNLTIRIQPAKFTDTYTGYDRIFVFYNDTLYIRKVVGAEKYSDHEALTLDSGIGVDLNVGEQFPFGDCILARFENNQLDIRYRYAEGDKVLATASAVIVELPQEYEEF